MREQFTFYRSFWMAVKGLNQKDQLSVFRAICAYALDGEETKMTPAATGLFVLIKPVLDAAEKKAKSGKQGGSKPEANAKQTGSKPEANRKQGENRREKEGEKEKEREIEDECLQVDGDLAKVFDYFLDRVDPMPSSSCTEDLKAYTENMGADVVIHACEVARDAKGVQAGWSYIRGILRRYAENKVKSMEDVLRLEQAHQNKTKMPTVAPTSAYATPDDVAKALELFEGVS